MSNVVLPTRPYDELRADYELMREVLAAILTQADIGYAEAPDGALECLHCRTVGGRWNSIMGKWDYPHAPDCPISRAQERLGKERKP